MIRFSFVLLLVCILLSNKQAFAQGDTISLKSFKQVDSFYQSQIKYFLKNDTNAIVKIADEYFKNEMRLNRKENIPARFNVSDSLLNEIQIKLKKQNNSAIQNRCDLSEIQVLDYAITPNGVEPYYSPVYNFTVTLKLAGTTEERSRVFYSYVLVKKQEENCFMSFVCDEGWNQAESASFENAKEDYVGYIDKGVPIVMMH